VARLASAARHRATVRERTLEGHAAGLVHVQPLHLVDVRPDGNRILPIRDVTARVIGQMALLAMAISLVSLVLIVANRQATKRR
jgi:hypothetical protein